MDDEEVILKNLASLLKNKGYKPILAKTAEEIFEKIYLNPDVILLDMRLPDGNGIDLIPSLKKISPKTQIIMISGYGEIKDAVRAIKEGAFDFLEKPIESERLFVTLKNALDKKRLLEEKDTYQKKITSFYKIIGSSSTVKKIYEFIDNVKDLDSAVLITGETGTGKDLLATLIHLSSKRKDKKFIKINCAAIPAELLESELFGYKKGAFTGAAKDKKGRIEEAEGGTLFLNEIGDMPLFLQPKLLRFIEEKRFERLGDTKTTEIDTRIIAATNRNLEKEVEKGNFRKDLFFRLNSFSLYIPPLRERKEDIVPLLKYYTVFYAEKFGTIPKDFTQDALDFLLKYPWYGNVRELQNFIERAVVMEKEKLINRKKALKYLKIKREEFLPLKKAKKKFEKEYIKKVIEKTKNLKKAAEALKISRMQLYRKIKEYKIT